MRAPLSWIREFTPVDAPVADIADALNQLGLEVEGIDEPGREIGGVVVARIEAVVPHPDADRIRLADVDAGDGPVRVVCGAPNIEPGMVVPFARVGAHLPGDFKIERRKIRGQVSEGMLCSARELGLGDDHAGILELPSDAPLGADVREVLGLDDVVFDLSITPNRPDAMGVIGIARDLAAHFGLPLHVESLDPGPVVDQLSGAAVVVDAPDRCPRFVAMVAGVTMGESPDWMKRRLVLAGMRPISNVVDVTNYVMLERCRPLHAFDLGRLAGRGIVVRLAEPGEKMETLDGVERELTVDDLLICDAERVAQGIAGIMGGAAAEVSGTTTEILLESAYFEPSGIAKTSKRLGLRSEASARFERGVDPNDVAAGAATRWSCSRRSRPRSRPPARSTCTPSPSSARSRDPHAAREPAARHRPLRPRRAAPAHAARDRDRKRHRDRAHVAARPRARDRPRRGSRASHRPRQHRAHGSLQSREDRLAHDRATRAARGRGRPGGSRLRRGVHAAAARGGRPRAAGSPAESVIEVANPLRAEESVLRPSLLPGLLRAVGHNAAHGNPDVAIFELGRVFAPPPVGQTLPIERLHLAVARAGRVVQTPYEPDRPVTAHDVVAAFEAIAQELRLADWKLVAASPPAFHPVRAANVVVDGAVVGSIGEIDAEVRDALALPAPVVALHVDVDALLVASRSPRAARPLSRFPSSTIDLAFVVGDDVPAGSVLDELRVAGGELLESARLFDEFRSESLGAGRVSLAFALEFRADDRTLTDGDVGDLRRRCIDAVVGRFGAELRG